MNAIKALSFAILEAAPSPQRVAHELWGEGYTVVRRQADPYYVDPRIIPTGMAYQWCNVEKIGDGWKPVTASRHDGIYAPVGFDGDIGLNQLVLCERAKSEVDAARAANEAKAHQNVADWVAKTGGQFTGTVKVGTSEDHAKTTEVGDAIGSGDETHIPKELVPYIIEILRERDALLAKDIGHSKYGIEINVARNKAVTDAFAIIRERHKDELHANPT